MRRVWVFLCALLVCAGCTSDGNKSQWDEVWKDLRGENNKMRTGRSMTGAWDDFGSTSQRD